MLRVLQNPSSSSYFQYLFFLLQLRTLLLRVEINPAIWENRQNEIAQGLS